MKAKTFKKYYGLEYVTVRNVPMVKTAAGYGFEAELMGQIEREISREILARRIPLRGKEVQFIRKSFGLSMRALGEILGLSHVAIQKWEKHPNKRLDLVNEIAVRATIAEHIHMDMLVKDVVLRGVNKPPKIEIAADEVA